MVNSRAPWLSQRALHRIPSSSQYIDLARRHMIQLMSEKISDGETEFRLYINNLFDNRPFLDTDLTAGVDRSTTIRPRTIGLEVRRRF